MAELIWRGKNTKGEQYDHVALATHLTTIETLNGSSTQAVSQPEIASGAWYNRLIAGDKSDVLPALFPEFAQQIDLIYIDPPFMTGRNFTSGSQPAYNDTWNRDLDIYLQWLYEAFVPLHRLLAKSW